MNIVKNTVNKIALTLTEKALYANSEWLIKLENDMNGDNGSKVFAVDDISDSVQRKRANVFYVTESETEDLLNATVSLSPTGRWNYIAYEMAPSSPRSLDTNNALSIVETGICMVTDPTEGQVNVFDVDENKNNATFDEP